MLRALVFVLLVLCTSSPASAQVGISSLYHLEVDTVAINIGTVYENSGPVDLAGFNTYRVYVVADSTAQPQSVAMVGGGTSFGATSIETTTAFFQHSLGGVVPTSTDGLTDFFPALEYDSWVTIGIDGLADPLLGEDPIFTVDSDDSDWLASFDPGGGLPGENLVIEEVGAGGSWFTTNGANGVLNPGGRVLLGQFTTDGTFSGQMAVGFLNPGFSSNLILTLLFGEQEGCTDPDACNYQSYATLDDCSCLYEDVLGVCGGSCFGDEDSDGLCDAVDFCSSVLNGGPAISGGHAELRASESGHRMVFIEPEAAGENRRRLIVSDWDGLEWSRDTLEVPSLLQVPDSNFNVGSIEISAAGDVLLIKYSLDEVSLVSVVEEINGNWLLRGQEPFSSRYVMAFGPQGDVIVWMDYDGDFFFSKWINDNWSDHPVIGIESGTGLILSDFRFSGDQMSGFFTIGEIVPSGLWNSSLEYDLMEFGFYGDSIVVGDAVLTGSDDPIHVDDVSFDGETLITGSVIYSRFNSSWVGHSIGSGPWSMDSSGHSLIRKLGSGAVLYDWTESQLIPVNGWNAHPSGYFGGTPILSANGEAFIWPGYSSSVSVYLIGTGCGDLSGCMDPLACNFSLAANQDDGTCQFLDVVGICGGGCTSDLDEDGLCDDVDGCSDTTACNYWLCNALECQYMDGCGLCGGMAPEGADCDCPDGVIDVLGNCGGTCLSDTNGNGICDDEECLCGEGTVWSAETSRCELETPIEVTMMTACGPGTVWDSTAEQCLPLPDLCPSDVDSDGYVAINDLLTLLSSFMTVCPE